MIGISPETYRLIAGSVSDAGIRIDGELVPIEPENRGRIAAAVLAVRNQAKPETAQVP